MNGTEVVGSFFALDVGLDSVRLAEMLGNFQDNWILEAFAYMPIDRKLVIDSGETELRELLKITVGAMQQADIRSKNVALSLPKQLAYVDVIQMPAQDQKSVGKLMQYQANQYIPIDIEAAQLDYCILGSNPNDLTKIDVMVAAVKYQEAEKWRKAFAEFGLNLVRIEPDDIAVARALMPYGNGGVSLLVFMNEDEIRVTTCFQDKPRAFKTINLGFDALMERISAKLQMERNKTRSLVASVGFFTDQYDGQLAKLLDEEMGVVTVELVKIIDEIKLNYASKEIDEIILGGFLTIMPAVAQYFQLKFNLPARMGNPFQKVNLSTEQKQALEPVAGEFSTVVGLAEAEGK